MSATKRTTKAREFVLVSTGLRPADPLGAPPPPLLSMGALPPNPRGISEAMMGGSCEGMLAGGMGHARMACKPDSVQGLAACGWSFILRRDCPRPSGCQPGPSGAEDAPACAARSLFGIAPGGACRAASVASRAVRSYRTVSPLPPQAEAVSSLWRCPWGCPRRALPGTVSSWSPDFPLHLGFAKQNKTSAAGGSTAERHSLAILGET